MRTIKYLSPSSLAQWESNPQEFYCTRLSEVRMSYMPQTQPMSIGSAVDARWKEYIVRRLLGDEAVAEGTQFHLESLFKDQVEEQHRDWAWHHSKYLMDCYIDSGAMADLMVDLAAGSRWQFEFTLEKTMTFVYQGEEIEVPLLGKPDCYFHNKDGCGIVLDLKVNGFCSKSKVSPASGYVKRRAKMGREWINKGEHKNALLQSHKGVTINAVRTMDSIDDKWAAQLSTYAWMYGEDIGSDFVCGIEQFACGPAKNEPVNEVEIVSIRGRVSSDFQERLAQRFARCWKCLSEGRVFPDLTYDENRARMDHLDTMLKDPMQQLMIKYT